VVGDVSAVRDFSAPVGGVVTGVLSYAGTSRPLIAPVGYGVADGGDRVTLFPTVSGAQRYGQGFRVDRLHAGPVRGQLLDVTALREQAEQDDVLVPEVLLDSAPVAERRTPYWLSTGVRTASVRSGEVRDLGTVAVTVHG